MALNEVVTDQADIRRDLASLGLPYPGRRSLGEGDAPVSPTTMPPSSRRTPSSGHHPVPRPSPLPPPAPDATVSTVVAAQAGTPVGTEMALDGLRSVVDGE